jgi:hypothetical protein
MILILFLAVWIISRTADVTSVLSGGVSTKKAATSVFLAYSYL